MYKLRYLWNSPSKECIAEQQQACEHLYYQFKLCERMLGFNDSKCRIEQLGKHERCVQKLEYMRKAAE